MATISQLAHLDVTSGREIANLVLDQDGIYEAFTKWRAETVGAMKVADGFKPGAVIGPLIDINAVEKVEAHCRRGQERRQGRY